jgi:hypothetical protein
MDEFTKYVDLKRMAFLSAAILCIPLVAMLVTEQVRWQFVDFIVAFVLLFIAGSSIQVTIKHPKSLYKFSAALVFMTVAILWAILAA